MGAYINITFVPGSVSASNPVNLPSNAPPIDTRFTPTSTLFRGSDGTTPAAEVSCSVNTVTDESTIQLDTATNTTDLLKLSYIPKGKIKTWQ